MNGSKRGQLRAIPLYFMDKPTILFLSIFADWTPSSFVQRREQPILG